MLGAVCISAISLLFAPPAAKAGDTSVWKNFELIASKGNMHTGTQRLNIPTESGSTLAEMLNRYSALFVKYYGPGSLASTSMRGMGAQHTAVLWNGVNLQSSMNSNFDLNLLPAFFIDRAAVETGASSAACGNGSLAGAVVLQNQPGTGRRLFAESTAGSFGKREIGAGFQLGTEKFRCRSRVLYKEAENNFAYANVFLPGRPMQHMSNNRFQQLGFMQEFFIQLKGSHQLYANLLMLNTARQLPPVMGAAADLQEKQNDVNRFMLIRHQAKIGKYGQITNKLAALIEKIDYFNQVLPAAYNTSKSLQAETELKRRLGNFDLLLTLNGNVQYAETDGYRNGKTRNIATVITGSKWQSNSGRTRLYASNRLLFLNGKLLPLTPETGAEFSLKKRVTLKANASLSYRIPSFNDLYWLPGGNPNLRPEKGRKAEASAEYKLDNFKLGVSLFVHRVENWIMWQPVQGSNNWMALNARLVNSRGLEMAAEGKLKTGPKAILRAFGRYQFVHSVNAKVNGSDNSIVGKILTYTPLHTAVCNLQYLWGTYRIQAGVVYTGSRFTNAVNSASAQLSPFSVCNASISREFKFRASTIVLDGSVLNLLNTAYVVFENRPMPLRNYQISLKFNLQK